MVNFNESNLIIQSKAGAVPVPATSVPCNGIRGVAVAAPASQTAAYGLHDYINQLNVN